MKKISQLTTTTTLADTDVIPVVTGMTGTPVGKKIAVSNLKTAVNYHTHANQSALDLVSGTNTGDQDLSGYEPLKGGDDNYVTDAEKTKLANLSGTNTGDQTLPVKATGAEVTTGTDDAKFVTAKALADAGISASGSTDGWTADTETWSYVGAGAFSINGKDVRSKYPVGTRLKFTQSTVKYAVVRTAPTMNGSDTVVNIAVNTDYTIANDTITSPYYSYQACPAGYPNAFTMSAEQKISITGTLQTIWGWGFNVGNGNWYTTGKTVTFGNVFATAPSVVGSCIGQKTGSDPSSISDFSAESLNMFSPEAISTTQFSAAAGDTTHSTAVGATKRIGYAWIAIGTV